MEKWDACNESMNRIEGMSIVRGEPIPNGYFHLVCEILVRHTDGSYLLMQRDTRKPFGGLWEASAGGSALQGESPKECAIRELEEETGIRLQEGETIAFKWVSGKELLEMSRKELATQRIQNFINIED